MVKSMENHIANLVDGLTQPSNKQAHECLQALLEQSACSAVVYPFFSDFVQMLDSENSYIRTRGLLLIAANARWDVDYKIDEIIDQYLKHIMDDKPITARQCIKALPELARFKPELVGTIENALRLANPLRYPQSMQKLVQDDMKNALSAIAALA